jgi:hypothetical protein
VAHVGHSQQLQLWKVNLTEEITAHYQLVAFQNVEK